MRSFLKALSSWTTPYIIDAGSRSSTNKCSREANGLTSRLQFLATAAIILLFLSGCAANPFSQFYFDYTGGRDVTTLPGVAAPDGAPEVYTGQDVDADIQQMWENGYELLGYSSFNASKATEQQALAHGKSVKAAVILVYTEYAETLSGAVPLMLPQTLQKCKKKVFNGCSPVALECQIKQGSADWRNPLSTSTLYRYFTSYL